MTRLAHGRVLFCGGNTAIKADQDLVILETGICTPGESSIVQPMLNYLVALVAKDKKPYSDVVIEYL